jgi:hypothetical protein
MIYAADEYITERAGTRREQRGCERLGGLGCQTVWSSCLNENQEGVHASVDFFIILATQPS